jgi:EAL domain-containing protein (putative c-di-GMP-specific phosphodiesterase class I)
VNLSARQLVEPALVDEIVATHARHGLAHGRIVCEMTETALIDDPVRATDTVNGLVAAGMPVSLDDFCTGYSALVHLKRFPLSAIKLDRTFVAEVATNRVDVAVVRGLVEMATAMELSTVAEGIETRAQLDHLRSLGCDLAQGFIFAPGLVAEDLERLICGRPGGRFDLEELRDAA